MDVNSFINRNNQNGRALAQRQTQILEELERRGTLSVAEASEMFHVSLVTIRKDFAFLENQGCLLRNHGGVVRKEKPSINSPVADDSAIQNLDAKLRIAKAAGEMISDRDIIVINVGSTSRLVARTFHLKKDLIVITNSLQIFNEIAYSPNITSFFLGGRFDPNMQFTYGDDTIYQLSHYTADKLFIGMDGIDLEGGATTYNHVEIPVMHAMMERVHEKILIVDSSKFRKVAFAKLAPLSDFDMIITDYVKENEDYYEQLKKIGLKIIFV